MDFEEKNMRINIKQTAKGFAYYDVTVRGNTKEEISELLQQTLEIATVKCAQINQSQPSQDE